MKRSTFFTLFIILACLFSVRNVNAWLREGTIDLREYQGPVTDQFIPSFDSEFPWDTLLCALHSLTNLSEGFLNYQAELSILDPEVDEVIDFNVYYVQRLLKEASPHIDVVASLIQTYKCRSGSTGVFPNYENAFYSANLGASMRWLYSKLEY